MNQKVIKLEKKKIFDLKLQKNVFYYWYKYHRAFFHSLIWRGNKLFAFNFFIKIKYELKLRENIDPFLIIFAALLKITPDIILFSYKRSSGAQLNLIPKPITIRKQITFAVKWVIKLLRDRYNKVNLIYIVDLLIDSIYDRGAAIDEKKKVYDTALQNKYLIRYFS